MQHRKMVFAALLAISLGSQAQSVKVPEDGKKISNELLGIFFEDISSSADGGLNADLVQNGSFEFNATERDGWGAATAWRFERPGHSLGYIKPLMQQPLNENNPTYMRIHTERVGHYYDYRGWTGIGLRNDGYDGISVKAGQKYDFSAFLRCADGKEKQVRVVLSTNGTRENPTRVLADTTLTVNATDWQKYMATLNVSGDCTNANLQLLCLTLGDLDVDMVELMPEDTYKGHGLRKDLVEALADLHPAFMRFPGGCIVHGGGDGFWDTYRWKKTVGPKEQRLGLKNCWGYHQSFGLGYYEFFQLCEDIHMQPRPILPCGVSCQGANGGWSMKNQAQDVVPMDQMDEWVQDALDLIEWANGDASTPWGKVRVEAGHPAPFNLKYLGIGNEERISPEFEERFKYMYEKVHAAHPEITIVGTAGPGSHKGNSDYDNAWRLADEIGLPVIDEHYYEPRDYFLNNQHNYDSYPRTRTTKVYLGEYAAKDKKLVDALYEGLYLLGIERNGDVVSMTSYAPLFAKKGHLSWNPDLIYFDNERTIRTCSYYVQQAFGMTAGDYFYGDVVKLQNTDGTAIDEEKYVGQSCILNTAKKELYIKVDNASDKAIAAVLDLSRFSFSKNASLWTLQGDLQAENNFEQQPLAPATSTQKVSKKQTLTVQPHSFNVLTIQLK